MADGAGPEDEDDMRRLVDTIISEFIEIKRLDLLFQAQRTKWMAHVERWMTHHYSICSSLQLGARSDMQRPLIRADALSGLKLTPIGNGPGALDVSTTDTTDTTAISSSLGHVATVTGLAQDVALVIDHDAIPCEVGVDAPQGPHSHPSESCGGFLWGVKSKPKEIIGAQPMLPCRDDGLAPPAPPPYSSSPSSPGRSLRKAAAAEHAASPSPISTSLLSEIGLDCNRPEKPMPLRMYPEWDRPALSAEGGAVKASPPKIEKSKVETILNSGTEVVDATGGVTAAAGSEPVDAGGKAESSKASEEAKAVHVTEVKESKAVAPVEAAKQIDGADKASEAAKENQVFLEDGFLVNSRPMADTSEVVGSPAWHGNIFEDDEEDDSHGWLGIDRARLSQTIKDSAAQPATVDPELDKPVYDVSQFYHTSGQAQRVARSDWFAHITLSIISLNAVYIGVDADQNDADNLADADLGFQICENSFCVFFTFEWFVRFAAFRDKRNCCRDTWFKFDTALVALMILETWMNPLFLGGASTGLPTGMVKLLRLLRLARMARLMRAFPELVAMIKGVREASRAVGSALMMVLLLIYIFAIIMHMLLASYVDQDELLAERFQTLPVSMWTLFMDGTLLDGVSITTRALYKNNAYPAFFVLLLFVLMSAMTVMNMLIGVLCEVVTAVAAAEKEDAAIRLVKETVLVMLSKLDEDGSGEISKDEMSTVFDDEAALAVLSSLQVDIAHLVDYLDMYFEQQSDLSIHQIMDLILMLRGDRSPTMRDMLDREAFQRWKLNGALGKLETRLTRLIAPRGTRSTASSQSVQKLQRQPAAC